MSGCTSCTREMLLYFNKFFFFFNDTATTEIYTLSLHDALPILHPAMALFRHPRSPLYLSRGVSPKDRKSTRLNSSHVEISYAVFCLKKKNMNIHDDKWSLPRHYRHARENHAACVTDDERRYLPL